MSKLSVLEGIRRRAVRGLAALQVGTTVPRETMLDVRFVARVLCRPMSEVLDELIGEALS